MNYAFRMFWEANRVHDKPEYFSFREAFQQLLDATRMTRPQLAVRLMVPLNYLGAIESGKKKANQFHYERLRELALDYGQPTLAQYFGRCADRSADMVAASKGRKVRTGPAGDGFSEIKLEDW
jgi:transcriptional regulator with XRE-family HTH domain